MGKAIDGILWRYENTDFVLQMRARFLFALCLAILIIIPISVVYSSYVNLQSPARQINYRMLSCLVVTFLVVLAGFIMLVRGRFAVAAHTVFIAAVLAVWYAMVVDRMPALARLDTIVLILGLVAMTPLLVSRYKSVIFLYGVANILIMGVFLFVFRAQLALPVPIMLEYLAENALAIMFISIATYNTFNINQQALNRAAEDIQERKRAEEELADQKAVLEALNDAAHDGILMVDEDGRVITYNRGFCKMWGIPEAVIAEHSGEMIVRSVLDQLVDPQRQSFQQIIETIYHDRREGIEDEITLKNGCIFEWYSAPIHSIQGRYLGRVWFFHDITTRRAAEAEKTRLEEQLRQSQKMESIGRLAGGVAHDFNNLLTAIMGNTELALMKIDKDNPLQRRLGAVMEAAQSAGELTRQLLAFSRKQIIELKPVDLNELIEHMHKMLVRLIGEDIQLNRVPHPDSGLIKADRGQIEQIIINLAVNARDAMSQGGRLTIETYPVTLDETYAGQHLDIIPGEYIVLAVSDTGTGMSDEIKNHLFEPFFTTKPVGSGTGLGLAMVYGAVKQNSGSIEVYSAMSHGTTFKMYFPRMAGQGAAQPEAIETRELKTGTETILLVEDDPRVREFSLNTLTQLGYTVLPYANGEEALAAVQVYPQKIHLLFTDVILPGMNGRLLAEALTRLRSDVKVLFASGYTDNIIIRHGVLEEGINFISKPFTVHALARKLRDILDPGI